MITEKVSILMPVKNASPFLKECVTSIINQSYVNWELLAVDDASEDDSLKMLQDFASIDHRIKVFSNSGKGIISALSTAFSESNGEFIHRMDADDVMPNEKLDILVTLLKGKKRTVVTGRVQYFSDAKVSDGYTDYQNWINGISDYSAEVYRECTIASPNWLVSRQCFIEDISIQELDYPEDYDLVLKWYALGYTFLKTDEITHFWREHPDRTSRNSDIYQQESFFRLKLKHFIKNELDSSEPIQLIGANSKGKLAASILSGLDQPFEWFDYNKRRVASNNVVKDLKELRPEIKSLLANWPKEPQKQQEIEQFMSIKGFVKGKNYWIL
ncbi:MAG: glycosyltransferase family 2 protein [Crocinitomicaceae bacterium]